MTVPTSQATATYEIGDTPEEWLEFTLQKGWGDGLPVVPATPDRVDRFVEASRRRRDEVLGKMPPAWGETTVEKVAINAVMAGLSSELMPLVIATVEAILEPPFNLYGVQATTNPVAPAFIINGPARSRYGFNSGYGCLGPGNRSNATFGRALRLAMLNIGGAKPGTLDRATVGQPGKYTFTFAENEERNPWEPLTVSRGLRADDSAITAIAVSCVVNVLDDISSTADELLTTIAQSMTPHGTNTMQLGGEALLLLCPEHAEILARDGLTRKDVQRELYQRAVTPASAFTPAHLTMMRSKRGLHPEAVGGDQVHALDAPEALVIVVAGGDGPHSVFAPTFGDTQSITRRIQGGEIQ